MKTIKMKSIRTNNLAIENAFISSHIQVCLLVVFSLLMFSFLAVPSILTDNVTAAIDVDTSGNGRAAAYDSEKGIATNGDSF